MLRALLILMVGWLLIAAVGGLGHVLGLTVMLPPVAAVAIAYLAFSGETSLLVGLASALVLGYFADQHDGTPLGSQCLAHGLGFLALRWLSGRYVVAGVIRRLVLAALATILVDALLVVELVVLADVLGLRRSTIVGSLGLVGWHALAAALAAIPVTYVFDRVLWLVRLGESFLAFGTTRIR